ncbi:MAG: FeoB-associated Cys-rich membrane protein [Bacteroidetes bacterium]|nr:MAG: FeoB-associated Cys-rich membrane protein [Bacteroidota bacterium]
MNDMDIQLFVAMLLFAGAILFLVRKYFFRHEEKSSGCESCIKTNQEQKL